MDAWRLLLRHWSGHRRVPSLDMFRLSFPEGSYRLPQTDYTISELTELFSEDVQRISYEIAAMDLADAVQEQDWNAIEQVLDKARQIRNARVSKDIHVKWDDPELDIEARINRTVEEGIFTGIDSLDDQFPGHQPGSLVTYLGRAKAGKTSFLLLSALKSWRDGKKVLFLTVEITADGVADRLDAFGAEICYRDYVLGELSHLDADKLRKFRAAEMDPNAHNFVVIQPMSRYTLTDLEYDIDRYEPDVVYVDGFYFLIDRITNKPGGSWEGHDNLAREMKEMALRHQIVLLTTTQVREKQLGKKGDGIDDGAIMGGTGLIMASDMVLGFDADNDHLHTINCTRSRTGYLHTVRGKWNWQRCTFTVIEELGKADPGKFKYDANGNTNGGHVTT